MNKRDLSESDIKAKYITPAITGAGWDEQTQIEREVFFTDGRIYVKGRMTARGKRKFADYILFHKPNMPIAVVEAKDNKHSLSSGIQQALGYANTLDIPFVFSSNGDGFYFHDKTATEGEIEKEIALDEFPSPDVLWEKYIRTLYPYIGYFLHHVICSPYFQNMIVEVQTGAGREGLPKNKMDNIIIALPPKEEQKILNEKVKVIMHKCNALEEQIKSSEVNANMLMQAVLKEAFEGKQEVVGV